MNLRTRSLTTAWLGLFAMLLIVLAPLMSQLVIAHRAVEPETALCSATFADTGSHHSISQDSFAACSYCDLLATHAAMPSVPHVALPLLTLVVIATVSVLFTRFTPLGVFPSGRLRDPPAFL
ncbi:MAG: hypothetical protein CPDRYMAC_5358 [uncultured Paraburkholderia sp.]|nr:MAG: hypothetical protein CPDRYDRY_5267 [uncultured Paraburkholderia sp.]CAH2940744.1 MAG: hypothetical protein CPDRYMAC_5358 [uncultured Paraburkholderia sp.]